MKLNPERVAYLVMASRKKLGLLGAAQVEQVGEFSMRESELRIEDDRALEMLPGAHHGLRRRGVGQMQRLQILVVGQEARHVPPRQRRRG